MFDALFTFFAVTLFPMPSDTNSATYRMLNTQVDFYGQQFSFRYYIAFTGAFICEIIIFVLCCLFIYKIVRLIGGLIR